MSYSIPWSTVKTNNFIQLKYELRQYYQRDPCSVGSLRASCQYDHMHNNIYLFLLSFQNVMKRLLTYSIISHHLIISMCKSEIKKDILSSASYYRLYGQLLIANYFPVFLKVLNIIRPLQRIPYDMKTWSEESVPSLLQLTPSNPLSLQPTPVPDHQHYAQPKAPTPLPVAASLPRLLGRSTDVCLHAQEVRIMSVYRPLLSLQGGVWEQKAFTSTFPQKVVTCFRYRTKNKIKKRCRK